MQEKYIDTSAESSEVDENQLAEEAMIAATFDHITEKIKHGRIKDTLTSGAWGASEAMMNKDAADFLDLGIPEKDFDTIPYLNNVVHDWLIGKDLPKVDHDLLLKYYTKAIKKGSIKLPPEYLN